MDPLQRENRLGFGGLSCNVGASLVAQKVKTLPACRRPGLNSWVRKIAWRRAWQPTPVFLPGEFHGQRNLTSYSDWGRKESDTTERPARSLSFMQCWK